MNDIPPDPRSGSRRAPTGNPPGAPRKAYDQKRSKTSRREDERETYRQIAPVPFQQAAEGFLMLLRESGRQDMEYVCKKIFKEEWEAATVRERVEKPNPSVNPMESIDGMQSFTCNYDRRIQNLFK